MKTKFSRIIFFSSHHKDLEGCKGLTSVNISMSTDDESFIKEAIVGIVHFRDLENALSRKREETQNNT
jgi:hypothetical protein